jgi:hypothetical protein
LCREKRPSGLTSAFCPFSSAFQASKSDAAALFIKPGNNMELRYTNEINELKARLIRYQLDEAATTFMLRQANNKLTICAAIALGIALVFTRWAATTVFRDWD